MATNGESKAQQAGESAPLAVLARIGLIAYGIVHLLIGWLALQLAWGASVGKSADLSGALRTVADEPFGKSVLGLRVVSSRDVGLPLWRAFVRAFLCALFPIGLFWSAVSSRNESVQDLLVRTTVVYDWGPKLPRLQ